nr:ankyrin repeat domain-containing protein [Bacteroidota bacterium]
MNYLRPQGNSSLQFASMFGYLEVIKLLVENGAEVNSGTGQKAPIFKAIEFGTKECAQYLAEHGAEIPVDNFLLHQAAAKGMSGIVGYMLENGAEIYSINSNGGTLLHSASRGDLAELANFMIENGADINSRNRYGLTPLHLASINGNIACINLLISKNADVNLKTNTGINAYTLAYKNADQEAVNILKTAGAHEIAMNYMDVPGDIYFGLKGPGLISELFAPGIITTDVGEHGTVAISPNMDEIYWQAEGIKYIRKVNGKWTFPDTLEIFQKYMANNPAFSADGNKLYFHSPMSLEKDGTFKDNDLWFVKKTENGWSEPENLGPNVNSEYNELRPSLARNGNVYFSVNHDIFKSEYKNGQYQPREKLEPQINSEYRESSPYIAQDESFVIFESDKPGGIST